MTSERMLLVHAPSIHMGGGLHLLKALLAEVEETVSHLQYDARAAQELHIPSRTIALAVQPTFISRLTAEWRLRALSTKSHTVLCFHNLPPLFRVQGDVVVFVHSRLLVTPHTLQHYPWSVRLRILIERGWLRMFAKHAARFIVQTHSMESALRQIVGDYATIVVVPCAPQRPFEQTVTDAPKMYDFVYVASGDGHKNHLRLLDAWVLLAKQDIRPSLALTIDANAYPSLVQHVEQLTAQYALRCVNLGVVASQQIPALYHASKALIFPSWTESFGLPLIEAAGYGLPVLAAELDFVRDVVTPAQSFDPYSGVSIARAVQRFLGMEQVPLRLQSVQQFAAIISGTQ